MSVEYQPPAHIPARLLLDVRLCFAFFSRLPVKWPDGVPFSRLGPAMWAFPLVGWAVGVISLAIAILVYWPSQNTLISAVVFLTTGLLLTGAMHEDGLADVADGFGGGRDRAAKLTIMKDSRIGTYGVVALILALYSKAAGLGETMYHISFSIFQISREIQYLYAEDIERMLAAITLILGIGSVSRALAVSGMFYLSPAKEDGMGAEAGLVSFRIFFAAIMLATLPLLIFINPFVVLGALTVGGIGAALVMFIAHRQIGGYTGDVIGAIQIVTEILFLFVVLRFISDY